MNIIVLRGVPSSVDFSVNLLEMNLIKTMLKSLNILIFVQLLIGCTNKQTVLEDCGFARQTDDPRVIFSKAQLIPLEFIKESMIGQIKKIVEDENGGYFVLDKDQNIIFYFDEKGRYVSKLDKKGSGPGEYKSISDFNISDNKIEVLTGYSIISYDIGYNHIKSISLPYVCSHFKRIDPNTLVLYSFSSFDSRLSVYNTESKKVIDSKYKNFKHYSKMPVNSLISPFYSVSNLVYAKSMFTNDILQINHDKIKVCSTLFSQYPIDLTSNVEKNRETSYYTQYIINSGVPFALRHYDYPKYSYTLLRLGSSLSLGYEIKSNNEKYLFLPPYMATHETTTEDYVISVLDAKEAYHISNLSVYKTLLNKSKSIFMSEQNVELNPVILKQYVK